MTRVLVTALRMSAVTLLLTGILYPFAVTGLAQLLFPYQANGSLVRDARGNIIGSELIGQAFRTPAYFWPRPSAAGEHGYDAVASSGSNLGPTARQLRDRIAGDLARLQEADPEAPGAVPSDLVTASASGLDPHLSPAAALWQVARVARARGVTAVRVRAVVDLQVQGRLFGVLGEPRVNVLLLNLALDRRFGAPPRR
jgi:potassium-transporting ATPase KdpC subunit